MNVVLRARDVQKLAHAKRAIEEMLERVRRAQSRSCSPSHGGNRGSSPLGSANDFNDVVALEACRLATSPTFLQWTVFSKIGSRLPCDRRLEEADDWRSHRRAGIGAYL
jgi:hypothetical protein